jgi:TM2 domain-containing membrane protein YozV
MADDQWWYVLNAQQQGPISWAELQERAIQGLLRFEDPVWRAEMPQWVPARMIPGLFASSATAVSPPPIQVAYSPTTPSGKGRVSAALFAMLLGSFGAHKFYMGDTGLGVIYLLFFWTGIPTIIGLIEGIFYLTMSDQQFAEKYP